MPMGPNQLVARLKEATDHLIDSARQVARPGWVWIVGILYPGITVNLNFEELLQLAGELGEVTPEEVAEESAGVRELVGELAQREDLPRSPIAGRGCHPGTERPLWVTLARRGAAEELALPLVLRHRANLPRMRRGSGETEPLSVERGPG